MIRALIRTLVFLLLPLCSPAADTLTVQVFRWEDPSPVGWNAPYDTTIQLPDAGTTWRQILLVKSLKCDSSTAGDDYPCGEWDYITETAVFVPGKDGQDEKFQLISFVTPYGKRLKLGEGKGWTWVFDVTDYAPLLQGKRRIIAGNNQELQDLKFLFIRGTPPRDVLGVENLYPPGLYRYADLADDRVLQARDLVFRPDASGFKLKARISGHGHAGPHNCCEWANKTHTYELGEWEEFRWQVWKDCGFNPIYPQGGTWPFDRAGWCPGTAVDEQEFELTGLVFPGDTLGFDYRIEPYQDTGEKDGEYRMSHQLFSYGPPNFQNNATLVEILAPTASDAWSRINPICGNPLIRFRNSGNQVLRSLEIRYGETGHRALRFHWQGELGFMEEIILELPAPRWKALEQGGPFQVRLLKPNGKPDEDPDDDRRVSHIPPVTVFPQQFVLEIQTNDHKRARENSWSITDAAGGLWVGAETLTDSMLTREEIQLDPGCYRFDFRDAGEDGIMSQWWYRGSDPELMGISGSVRFLDHSGTELYAFPPDFGEALILNFLVQ